MNEEKGRAQPGRARLRSTFFTSPPEPCKLPSASFFVAAYNHRLEVLGCIGQYFGWPVSAILTRKYDVP